MKLYFAPETCSLSPHIVLRELGLPFELIRVNNKTKKMSDGGNFLTVNPKGYVAALRLDNGQVLTEGPAIVQYLADLKPDSKLAPPNGTWERTRLQEQLNFITSEIHAGCSPLFNSALPADVQKIFKEKLYRRFNEITSTLTKQPYLLGDAFGVADAYLFTVLQWMKFFDIDLNQWPVIAKYMDSIGARASVKSAIQAELASPAVQ